MEEDDNDSADNDDDEVNIVYLSIITFQPYSL